MKEFTENSCYLLNFAVDTNIIIGLINEEDRLHEDSLKLVSKAHKLLLPKTAVFETIGVFSKKAMEVLLDVFQYAVKFGNIEYSALLDYLDSKRPRYNNINKYVAKRALEIWEELRDPYRVFERISQMLSEIMVFDKIVEFIVNRIGKSLEGTSIVDVDVYEVDRQNSEELEKCEKILEKLRDNNIEFKDNFDKEIFIETVIYAVNALEKLTFVTDDEEFCKKAERALNVFDDLDLSRLSFVMLLKIVS